MQRKQLTTKTNSLESELGPAPVAALRVVADLVVRLVPEPLRNLPVLLCLASKLLLDHKRLVGRLLKGSDGK